VARETVGWGKKGNWSAKESGANGIGKVRGKRSSLVDCITIIFGGVGGKRLTWRGGMVRGFAQ